MVDVQSLLAPFARRVASPPGDWLDDGIRINFDQGLPDPSFFPVDDLARCLNETLRENSDEVLRYYGRGGPPEMTYGHLGLREQLATWIARRDGKAFDAAGVLLVNGSMDGLAHVVDSFLGEGDGAIVEAATYPHTRRFLAGTGAVVRTVPIDEHGMVVDDLEAELVALRDAGARPKLVYTIPTFHAPTGTVLPLERRRHLLDIARRWNVVVLEDNCYREFAYDEEPPPTLLALDDAGVVVQSDSFSKYVAPGLRMAWVAAASPVIDALAASRQDFAVSRVIAKTLERYMAEGSFDDHLERLRGRYRTKRDLTVAALREHCQPWVTFRAPSGGFYFWLEIHPAVDWPTVRTELARRGIAVRPGDGIVADGDPRRFVRLSCVQVPDADITTGIAELGEVLAAAAGAAGAGAGPDTGSRSRP